MLTNDTPVKNENHGALRAILALKNRKTAAAPLSDKQFWFIWAPSEQRPTRRHVSLESAQAEANRLKSIAPMKKYYIFRAERETVL